MQIYSSEYNILKNRMQNGIPFLKKNAWNRINALANDLVLSQQETEELTAIADKYGCEVLPEDAMGRLDAVEETTDELTLLVAEIVGGAGV